MSDKLDQIERLIESNARAILSLTNQSVELNTKIERTNAIIVELACCLCSFKPSRRP
jgi:hypothetical protein